MADQAQHERREVRYEGSVQGVGFRFSTRNVARRHEVVGYVQNLPDGCVRLVTEGAADELDRFLADIAETLGGHIRRMSVAASSATGQFGQFEIRF